MIDETSTDRYESRFHLIEDLREEFIIELGGADIIWAILAMGNEQDLNRAGPDYIDTLGEIVEILIKLCGDRNRGLKWLITSEPYRTISGNYPYHCLQHGSFWSLSIMLEGLKIIDQYRPVAMIEAIFSKPSQADHQIDPDN